MKNFKDKVAVITGAGNGFGKEFAKEAHKRGMRLFLADIDKAAVDQTVKEISEKKGIAKACVVDVSSEEGVNQMIDAAIEEYGQIDLLINNAGIARGGSIVDLPIRDWEWVIHVNCLSQVYAMKKVIPIMEKQGTPCHIINVASAAGLVTFGVMPAYFATKHFSVALSESVCYDLQETNSNVKISVFCPNFVKTNLYKCEDYRPERYKETKDTYYKSKAFEEQQKKMKHYITKGSSLDPIGKYVFDAVEADKFYIMYKTSPVLIKYRMTNLLKGRNPSFKFFDAASRLNEGEKSWKNLLTFLKLK